MARFPLRRRDRVSRIGHLERGQFVDMGVDDGRERPQTRSAFDRWQPCPAPLSRPRTLHRVVDRGGVGVVD